MRGTLFTIEHVLEGGSSFEAVGPLEFETVGYCCLQYSLPRDWSISSSAQHDFGIVYGGNIAPVSVSPVSKYNNVQTKGGESTQLFGFRLSLKCLPNPLNPMQSQTGGQISAGEQVAIYSRILTFVLACEREGDAQAWVEEISIHIIRYLYINSLLKGVSNVESQLVSRSSLTFSVLLTRRLIVLPPSQNLGVRRFELRTLEVRT
jgi:hypothetical protein